ncbi:MAG: hypothetical protein AAF741_03360 [Bacteroidota bacterium]
MTNLIDKSKTRQPIEWLWTIERYHQAIKQGVLDENDRVELIFGKLIQKIPTGDLHAAVVEIHTKPSVEDEAYTSIIHFGVDEDF